MSNPTQTAVDETINRLTAGFPLLWIQTDEHGRAAISIQRRLVEENKKVTDKIAALQAAGEPIPEGLAPTKVFSWDALNGLIDEETNDVIMPLVTGNSPASTPAYRHVLAWGNQQPGVEIPANAVIIVNGFNNLLDMTTEPARVRAALLQIVRPTTRIINQDNTAREIKGLRDEGCHRTVVLICPSLEHAAMTSDVTAFIEKIEFPRPNVQEIEETIRVQLENETDREGNSLISDPALVTQCASELLGTTLFQAENAVMLTYIKHRKLDIRELRGQYKKIIDLHPALNLAEFQETWENLIGFEVYKRYIQALFSPNNKTPKKGMLFLGVPGGGKSFASKATGQFLGRKTLQVNIGKVFHKHLGSSEGNMDSMIRCIDACGNIIVFIDELEKALGGMNGGTGSDGGTSDRIFERFLVWMNDHPEGPFLIGTANDVTDKLPQEFLREGRWNCIWYVPPPSLAQRKSLFELYGKTAKLNININDHAERTENWTGAEIKGLLEKAETLRFFYPEDETAVEEAYRLVQPLCKSNPARFQARLENGAREGINVNNPEEEVLLKELEPLPTPGKNKPANRTI